MTRRPDHDDDPAAEPLLTDAESAAVGRRIALLADSVRAPQALREQVAEHAGASAAGAGRAHPRPRPRRRALVPALGAGALALILAAVVVLAGGGSGSSPSVDDAAALALARPTAAAPAADGMVALHETIGGITFPNYAYQWPEWKAAGVRHDEVEGRAATTVTYRGPQGDVGYTIVDGAPLPEPEGGRRLTAGGIALRVLHRDGATVVTWRRDGHTCVLAGRGAGVERQLVRFATWA